MFISRKKIEIPSCQIDLIDFIRPFRSPLRHYLYHRDIYVREERVIQEEEAFHLSPLRRAILRKHALEGDAWKRAKKEGDFPIGPFRVLAEQQLEQEIAALPKNLETCEVNLVVGNVQLTGTLEGVCPEGLCVLDKKTMRNAVRVWPLFLVLAAIKPETTALLFARDGKKVPRFFDDPHPFLRSAVEYYFLSQHMPSPLFPEWIEPILKEDSAKLEKAMSYDASLRWALRGQKPLPAEELIAQWKEQTEKLYKEMADAWF